MSVGEHDRQTQIRKELDALVVPAEPMGAAAVRESYLLARLAETQERTEDLHEQVVILTGVNAELAGVREELDRLRDALKEIDGFAAQERYRAVRAVVRTLLASNTGGEA